MGSRAFGLFLRSQRQWATKPLADKDAQKFRDTCMVSLKLSVNSKHKQTETCMVMSVNIQLTKRKGLVIHVW